MRAARGQRTLKVVTFHSTAIHQLVETNPFNLSNSLRKLRWDLLSWSYFHDESLWAKRKGKRGRTHSWTDGYHTYAFYKWECGLTTGSPFPYCTAESATWRWNLDIKIYSLAPIWRRTFALPQMRRAPTQRRAFWIVMGYCYGSRLQCLLPFQEQ